MSLPGLNPTLASVTLSRLMTQWVELMDARPNGENSTQETDRLTLATVLLAHEGAELVRGTSLAEVTNCLNVARSTPWPALDEIPWLLVQGYVTAGKGDSKTIRMVERMLIHHDSSVRKWFHSVAWMIQSELYVEGVRPMLLQNLADKLGAVTESAGLLAVLHPDKAVLDAAADAFEPNGFEDQYRNRLQQIRELEWNSQAFNCWLEENTVRKTIWDTVKSMEVGG